MIDIDAYLTTLTDALKSAFGDRLLYVGLQGSYLRGDATENSDIDTTVLLRDLTKSDLDAYRTILDACGHADKACGFLCDAETFAHWNPFECMRLCHDTRDFYGHIADLVPPHTREDHKRLVLMELGNLYHALCHRYVHADAEKNRRKLSSHKKELFFLLQDLILLRSGIFPLTRDAVSDACRPEERAVYRIIAEDAQIPDYDFDAAFTIVLEWLQKTMQSIS